MGESDREQSELLKKIAFTRVKYQESLRRNQSLESELLAAEETVAGLRQKLRAANRKRSEAEHYRSLLHQLRSRWYLRPFIPARQLLVPNDDAADCWKFRGPRLPLRPTARLMGAVASLLLVIFSAPCFLEARTASSISSPRLIQAGSMSLWSFRNKTTRFSSGYKRKSKGSLSSITPGGGLAAPCLKSRSRRSRHSCGSWQSISCTSIPS